MDTTNAATPGLDEPLARRRFLAIGGLSVAAAAVITACGDDEAGIPQTGIAPTTTGLPDQEVNDAVLLRTGSSLEYSLVAVYNDILRVASLPQDAVQALTAFRAHHLEHAAAMEAATTRAGGTPFLRSNPVFDTKVVQPALAQAAAAGNRPVDIVSLAYALENVMGAMYQSFVPMLTTPERRMAVMTIGGAEGRHAAVLATLVEGSEVAPAPLGETSAQAAPTTTTTAATAGAAGPTMEPPPPVFQVPGAFGKLAAVEVRIGEEDLAIDIPGPNTYAY